MSFKASDELFYQTARGQIFDFITGCLYQCFLCFVLNCFRKSWDGEYLQTDYTPALPNPYLPINYVYLSVSFSAK